MYCVLNRYMGRDMASYFDLLIPHSPSAHACHRSPIAEFGALNDQENNLASLDFLNSAMYQLSFGLRAIACSIDQSCFSTESASSLTATTNFFDATSVSSFLFKRS